MIVITIDGDVTSMKTDDLQLYVYGGFKIKKEGAEAPTITINSE